MLSQVGQFSTGAQSGLELRVTKIGELRRKGKEGFVNVVVLDRSGQEAILTLGGSARVLYLDTIEEAKVYTFKGWRSTGSGDLRLDRGSIVAVTSGLDGFPENGNVNFRSIADLEGATTNGKGHVAGYVIGFGDESIGEDGLHRRVVAVSAEKGGSWLACEVTVWAKHVQDLAAFNIGDAVCFKHAWIKVDRGVTASLSDIGCVVAASSETKSSLLSSQWDANIDRTSIRALSPTLWARIGKAEVLSIRELQEERNALKSASLKQTRSFCLGFSVAGCLLHNKAGAPCTLTYQSCNQCTFKAPCQTHPLAGTRFRSVINIRLKDGTGTMTALLDDSDVKTVLGVTADDIAGKDNDVDRDSLAEIFSDHVQGKAFRGTVTMTNVTQGDVNLNVRRITVVDKSEVANCRKRFIMPSVSGANIKKRRSVVNNLAMVIDNVLVDCCDELSAIGDEENVSKIKQLLLSFASVDTGDEGSLKDFAKTVLAHGADLAVLSTSLARLKDAMKSLSDLDAA